MDLKCSISLIFHFLHICVEWNHVWRNYLRKTERFGHAHYLIRKSLRNYFLCWECHKLTHFCRIFFRNKLKTCKKRVPTWFRSIHTLVVELLIYLPRSLRSLEEIEQKCHNLCMDFPIQFQNHVGTLYCLQWCKKNCGRM